MQLHQYDQNESSNFGMVESRHATPVAINHANDGECANLPLRQQLFNELVQLAKVRFAHIAFDDLTAFIHEVGGGG